MLLTPKHIQPFRVCVPACIFCENTYPWMSVGSVLCLFIKISAIMNDVESIVWCSESVQRVYLLLVGACLLGLPLKLRRMS